ncbi:MAG: type I 3-dehydroquinate dehydratase [Planctomycetes bacterium]|nr:type I 3-dehydroquinate dehydratase [Planctomycetota bacterium]
MIIAVVAERNAACVLDVFRHLAAAHAPGGVMAELRLDALDQPDCDVILGAPLPVLATCRRETDGGWWKGSEEARFALLQRALRCGAVMVDVELDAVARWTGPRGRKLLVSHHDPTTTPRDLEALVSLALQHQADKVKLATKVNNAADVLALTRACDSAPGKVVAFGLGADALGTRLLFRRIGSPWVYARARGSSAREQLSAPGLPDMLDLTTLYYPDSSLPEPVAAFAILAEHPATSIGPLVFAQVFRAIKLPAIYVPLPTQGIGGLREMMRRLNLRGVSVTSPLKESVLHAADSVHPLARAIGAANTLHMQDGKLTAWNTDYYGVREVMLDALGEDTARGAALVVGAGGAARAAALALLQLGFEVTVTNRNMERAEHVAQDLGVHAAAQIDSPPRVIVNATPVGGSRAPGVLPVPEKLLAQGQILFDMNYRPRETSLLRAGRARGAKLLGGERMYAVQATHQMNIWWGHLPNVTRHVKEAVTWALRERISL